MVTNIDRLLDVANDDLRYENPLAYVLTFGVFRADLAAAVSATTGVSVTGESAVPRYPLETQAEASDHIVPRAVNIVLTGFVNDGDVEGSAEGVISEFERIRKEGVLVTVGVPSDVFDNCVVKRVTTTRNASTGRAYQVSVEFEQVLLGTAVARPEFDIDRQPPAANVQLLTDESYLQLVGDDNDAVLNQRRADELQGVADAIDNAILTQLGPLDDGRQIFPDVLTDDQRAFVREQVRLSADFVPLPGRTLTQEVAARRDALQFGHDPRLPVLDVDMWRLPLTNQPSQSLTITREGTTYEIELRNALSSDAPTADITMRTFVWFLDVVVRYSRFRNSKSDTVLQPNVPVHVGSNLRGNAGAFIPVSRDPGARTLGRRPWGITHDLVFTNNLAFLGSL